MNMHELTQRRDALCAAQQALLKECFTIEQLADYMLDNGVLRMTKTGKILPRERAKISLIRTLYSAKNLVKDPELQLHAIPLFPERPNIGMICTKAEGERRLRVELARQEKRLVKRSKKR